MTANANGFDPNVIPKFTDPAAAHVFVADYVTNLAAKRSAKGEDVWLVIKTSVGPNLGITIPEATLMAWYETAWAEARAPGAARARPTETSNRTSSGPEHRTLGSVKTKVKRWVWRGWLPEGDVVIGEGMGGIGKSLSLVDLSARLTAVLPMPDGSAHPTGTPWDTLYITNEDDFSTVVLPRLIAAGGDPDRVHIIEADFTMPRDLDLLKRVVTETGARLIFIDPIFSHIESNKVNPNHDSEMREHVMKPLAGVAKEHHAVVFLMRHFNKASGSSVTLRGSGSYGGLSGAARSIISAVPEPGGGDEDDGYDRRTIIGVTKSNYGITPKALVFSTQPRYPDRDPVLRAMLDEWADEDEPPVWTFLDSIPVVVWQGTASMSVETAQMRLDAKHGDANKGRQGKADATLHAILDGKGKVPASLVYAAMQSLGAFGRDATRGARDRLGVTVSKDGAEGSWLWSTAAPRSQLTGGGLSSNSGVTSVSSDQAAPTDSTQPDLDL